MNFCAIRNAIIEAPDSIYGLLMFECVIAQDL